MFYKNVFGSCLEDVLEGNGTEVRSKSTRRLQLVRMRLAATGSLDGERG